MNPADTPHAQPIIQRARERAAAQRAALPAVQLRTVAGRLVAAELTGEALLAERLASIYRYLLDRQDGQEPGAGLDA